MRILLLLSFISCALIQPDMAKRDNETKIRDLLSSKKNELFSCLDRRQNISTLELLITVGVNKQVKYFTVVSKPNSKRIVDCLFKKLDLFYFKSTDLKKDLSLVYTLHRRN